MFELDFFQYYCFFLNNIIILVRGRYCSCKKLLVIPHFPISLFLSGSSLFLFFLSLSFYSSVVSLTLSLFSLSLSVLYLSFSFSHSFFSLSLSPLSLSPLSLPPLSLSPLKIDSVTLAMLFVISPFQFASPPFLKNNLCYIKLSAAVQLHL